MDWKEIGRYRDHIVWVRAWPSGGWVAAIVPNLTAPDTPPVRMAPPDDRMLPEPFSSEAAAVAAAMRFLDRRQSGPAERRDP